MATVGIIGGSSYLAAVLLDLLSKNHCQVIAFSRQKATKLPCEVRLLAKSSATAIDTWFYLAPIWTIEAHQEFLLACGAKRIIALSSTSRFTKQNATDKHDLQVAQQLQAGESFLQAWGAQHNINWVILRPTLMYGYGKDSNISEIIRLAKLLRCFVFAGKAEGLRQPVHVADVAAACICLLAKPEIINKSYNLAGGEVLTYKAMVLRIINQTKRNIKTLHIKPVYLKVLISMLRRCKLLPNITFGMFERMNQDLVFSTMEAQQDFAYAPRGFTLSAEDI